jgi:hypothetical protein
LRREAEEEGGRRMEVDLEDKNMNLKRNRNTEKNE